jgi:hypothetical protein
MVKSSKINFHYKELISCDNPVLRMTVEGAFLLTQAECGLRLEERQKIFKMLSS